jgi:hypothetical protein
VVTRAARAWDPPQVIGMGYVRKEANALGSILQWSKGNATVVRFSGGLYTSAGGKE